MTSQSTNMMRVMPREMRLMSERILSLSSLPKGFSLPIIDLPMYSQKLGLGGFARLEQMFETFGSADPSRLSVTAEDGNCIVLEAGGQHAWFVLPSALDLAGELTARFGSAQVIIENVDDISELAIANSLGGRFGLQVSVEGNVLRAAAAPVTGDVRKDDPLLWSLLEEGARLDTDLWWRVYHLAKKALATDSVVSRRHAGPMIVTDDGTVIGRKDNDDDTDVSFLASRISEREREGARP